MTIHQIRLVIAPNDVIEVGDAELDDLKRQGFVKNETRESKVAAAKSDDKND